MRLVYVCSPKPASSHLRGIVEASAVLSRDNKPAACFWAFRSEPEETKLSQTIHSASCLNHPHSQTTCSLDLGTNHSPIPRFFTSYPGVTLSLSSTAATLYTVRTTDGPPSLPRTLKRNFYPILSISARRAGPPTPHFFLASNLHLARLQHPLLSPGPIGQSYV
jgi:hypothetical protein